MSTTLASAMKHSHSPLQRPVGKSTMFTNSAITGIIESMSLAWHLMCCAFLCLSTLDAEKMSGR
eukprot:3708326-Karenia_brevis.AAC.1